MPAQSSGLEGFGGHGAIQPNITQSNSLPGTPFLGKVADAGVGTGSLGEFGGYIPTPLNQFNNYADYMNYMPGAQQMDFAASFFNPQAFQNISNLFMNPMTSDGMGSPGLGASNNPMWAQGGNINNAAQYAMDWDPVIQDIMRSQLFPAANQQNADATALRHMAQPFWDDTNNLLATMPQFLNQIPAFMQQIKPFMNQIPEFMKQIPAFMNQIPTYMNQIPGAMEKANRIWEEGADPQDAVRQRTQQRLQEQSRAGLEARGLDMTPYGAGVEGSTMKDFDIDWENNVLARMAQGAQGYEGLMGTAANLGGAARNMLGGGVDALGGAVNALGGAAGAASGAEGLAQTAGGLSDAAGRAATTGGGLLQGAAGLERGAAAMQQEGYEESLAAHSRPWQEYQQMLQGQENQMLQAQGYDTAGMHEWGDIQNQFLTANQQSFNQNQTSGFEDPFAMLQLQSQIEMQREQMNMQEQMMEKQMKQQMMMQGAQAGMGMMGGMGGK